MDRPISRCGYLLAVCTLAAVVASAGGCKNLITMAAYLIAGTDVDADYSGLKGKKVAVVCRPVPGLTFANPTVARDIARQVGILLRTNVAKIKLIDPQKVNDWTDANDWNEYPEVGKGLQADMVVGIDLQDFAVYQGQTLYQGRATVGINVYDCADGDKVVFEKSLPRATYPPHTGIPTSEMPETEFRRKFVKVLADQIARHFYSHDPHADLTQDVDAM